MASPNSSVRHRGGQNPKKSSQQTVAEAPARDTDHDIEKPKLEKAKGSEWDFKLTAVILTLLAFATRFYGINHPNQVVFDEVHFGKVSTDPKEHIEMRELTCFNSVVRFLLPRKTVFLRRTPSLWKIAICFYGLARWI